MENIMNRIKQYVVNQASRPFLHLTYDFVVVAAFLTCVYFGFIVSD